MKLFLFNLLGDPALSSTQAKAYLLVITVFSGLSSGYLEGAIQESVETE